MLYFHFFMSMFDLIKIFPSQEKMEKDFYFLLAFERSSARKKKTIRYEYLLYSKKGKIQQM